MTSTNEVIHTKVIYKSAVTNCSNYSNFLYCILDLPCLVAALQHPVGAFVLVRQCMAWPPRRSPHTPSQHLPEERRPPPGHKSALLAVSPPVVQGAPPRLLNARWAAIAGQGPPAAAGGQPPIGCAFISCVGVTNVQ